GRVLVVAGLYRHHRHRGTGLHAGAGRLRDRLRPRRPDRHGPLDRRPDRPAGAERAEPGGGMAEGLRRPRDHAGRRSYQPRERFTIQTMDSITGTSISTPTTVASAAPEWTPNRLMAVATASSKKLLAPIRAEGPATLCDSPATRLSQ